MQITIDEYASRFKMSKEMVRAKLRAGRLPHTVVDGTTFIIIETPSSAPKQSAPQRTTAGALIMMYQKENAELKRRIGELEAKIDRLIGDKEQMLRDERDRIEHIYVSRDEQLKSFLELVNAKLVREGFKLAAQNASSADTADTAAVVGVEDAEPFSLPEQVELFYYLDAKHFTSSEVKTVKKRFAKAYGNDIRVIQQNGEFILDFSKYDYTDLLAR